MNRQNRHQFDRRWWCNYKSSSTEGIGFNQNFPTRTVTKQEMLLGDKLKPYQKDRSQDIFYLSRSWLGYVWYWEHNSDAHLFFPLKRLRLLKPKSTFDSCCKGNLGPSGKVASPKLKAITNSTTSNFLVFSHPTLCQKVGRHSYSDYSCSIQKSSKSISRNITRALWVYAKFHKFFWQNYRLNKLLNQKAKSFCIFSVSLGVPQICPLKRIFGLLKFDFCLSNLNNLIESGNFQYVQKQWIDISNF